jgi:hypothetical protein
MAIEDRVTGGYNNSSNCYHCRTRLDIWLGIVHGRKRTKKSKVRNQINPITPDHFQPINTVSPQVNTTVNQTTQQAPQVNVNSNTFITQEEEIQQPVSTVWERVQHLN